MDEFLTTILRWLGIESGFTLKYVGLRGGLPLWALLVLMCLGFALAGGLYVAERGISRGRRIPLAVLRAITFSLILIFLFAPVIGLERSQNIRPNVIVLADRSASMNIADPRSQPADVADAALASGAAQFAMPQEQEAVARAQRASLACAAAMKQLSWEGVLAAQNEIEAALSEVVALPAAVGEGNPPAVRPEAITTSIHGLVKRQKELRGIVEALPKDAPAASEQVAQLRERQEAFRRDLEVLATELAAASVPLASAAKRDQNTAPISRSAMAKGLLDRPELGRLRKECNVHYFSFGEKIEEIGTVDGVSEIALSSIEPNARSTRGSQAIRDAVARCGNQPIAGVFMLTDGAFNDENTQPLTTANWLKEQGVPLYAVGLGLQSPQDVGLRSLITQDVIFPKDTISARVQVTSNGYNGVKTEVIATLDGKEVAKRPIGLTDEPQFVELTFRVPEGKGGLRQLGIAVASQPGEVSTSNNKLEKTVRVVDQKIKVLFVEGRPRWEYRYLRVLLQRDPRLDVKFLMTQGDSDLPAASKEYLARYPEKPEDAFVYDLVILGDVPSWYFNRPQLERMAELVRDRGGAVLMLAGEQYAPVSYVDTPLAEMLPVRITRDFLQLPESVHPVATTAGKRSFAMLDDSTAANDEAWKLICPLHKVPRLDGSKPGASVLAEIPEGPNRPEPYPLIAWQYAGSGKVMYVGTDQLWRLRLKLGDQYHSRFWGQAIQFLALSRLLGENKRIRIEADKTDQIRTGERIEIHANVLDPTYQPVTAEKYAIQIARMAQDSSETAVVDVVLVPVPGSPGLFQGSHVFREEGRFTLKAAGSDARFANSLDVVVSASDLEALEPAMQESLLRKMSAISSGRFVGVREWPTVPGLVQARQRVVVESKEMDLWDSWPLFIVLLLSAGTEWFFRRRFNLV